MPRTVLESSSSSNAGRATVRITDAGAVECEVYDHDNDLGVTLTTAPGLVPLNNSAWRHVAVTRNADGLCTIWVEGVPHAAQVRTGVNIAASNQNYIIGASNLGGTLSDYYSGYIDEMRITEGVARYEPTIAVPTTEPPGLEGADTNFNSVVLLLLGDGAEGSANVVDSSASAKAPLTSTGVQISTNAPRFGTGSLDGVVSPQLIYSSSTDFNRRPICTIEAWIRWSTGQEGFILSASPVAYVLVSSSGQINFVNMVGASLSAQLTNGVWHHVAAASDGTTARLFLDGALVTTSSAMSEDLAARPFGVFGVPTRPDLAGFTGNLEQVRFTQGVCRYTSAFTAPTAAFPTSASGEDPFINDVWLLLNCNGANASTSFIDSSPNNRAVTAVGGAQITTTNPRFGTGAAIFDGNGDYLTTPGHPAIGTGDFTIECWAFVVDGTGSQALVCASASDGGPNGPWRFESQSGQIWFTTIVGSQVEYIAGKQHPVGSWFHVAAVRQSGVLRIFVDGEMLFAGEMTTDLTAGLSDISVGAVLEPGGGGGVSPTNFLNGRIDALRITVGHARYSASFTPPSAEFPTGGGSVGLGDFSDFGSAGWAISKNGTAIFNNLYARGAIASGGFSLANWDWPTSGGGFHIGPQGIRLGRESSGSWLELGADGNVRAPGFTIINGNATFSGSLSAATGTFAGSLSANVVNTENIVGAAVSTVVESQTAGTTTNVTITVPAGARSLVVQALGGAADLQLTIGSGKSALTAYARRPTNVTLSSALGSASNDGIVAQSFTNPAAGTYTFTATRSNPPFDGETVDGESYRSNLVLIVLLTKR